MPLTIACHSHNAISAVFASIVMAWKSRSMFLIRKTLCLLFVLFLLAASRKSTNTGKYCLLEKRNPFYFLAYFFYFSATFFTFGLLFTYLFPILYFFFYFYMYFTSLLF